MAEDRSPHRCAKCPSVLTQSHRFVLRGLRVVIRQQENYTMLIRKATPSDFAQAARNAIAALPDDELDEFLYPYRREHPAAYLAAYRKSIPTFAAQEHCYVIVAELEPSDTVWKGKKEIVGHAQWVKESKASENIWGKFFEAISEYVGNLRHHTSALFNASASLSRSLAFDTSPSSVKYFSPDYKDPGDKWHLADIIVSPSYQKLGVGTKLLEWGMKRANKDNIPVVLESTKAGLRMYEKAGFVGIGIWTWGKKKQLASRTMRWDPPSTS